MKRLGLSALLVLSLAACVTTPAPPESRTTVPADRLLVQQSVGDAEIVVVRDLGFLGSGCFQSLTVNGKLVARMDKGETVRMRVPAGDLLLATGRDPEGRGMCSFETDYRVAREFVIRAGEVKRFRMVIGSGGLDLMRWES